MRILVIGRHGQLARALAKQRPSWASPRFLAREECDLSDPNGLPGQLRRLGHFDGIINAAGYTAVDQAQRDVAIAMAVNGTSSGVLGSIAARWKAPIIYISTDHVFDGSLRRPYTEADAIDPINCYGASKAFGEAQLRAATDRHVVIRTSWLYSPGHKNFVSTIIERAQQGMPLSVVDDQYGSPTAALGLASAIWRMMPVLISCDASHLFGTFHYCDAGVVSKFRFAEEILRQYFGTDYTHLLPRATDRTTPDALRPPYAAMDCTKIRSVHGIQIAPWQQTLRLAIASKKLPDERENQ